MLTPVVLQSSSTLEPWVLTIQALVSILVILGALKSYINGEIRSMIESIKKIDQVESDVDEIQSVLVAVAKSTEHPDKTVPVDRVRETFYDDTHRPADYIARKYGVEEQTEGERFVEERTDGENDM